MTRQQSVARHWATPIVIDQINLENLVHPSAAVTARSPGPRCEQIPPESVVIDTTVLKDEFLASFNALADGQGTPPITDVHLEVQVWRPGHDLPANGFAADYVGWCYLATSPSPAHSESGAISFADPRAGSAMTAMPGLPWGRQVMIRPTPGAHTAVPGWLTSSVVPVEEGQFAVVAFASSVR